LADDGWPWVACGFLQFTTSGPCAGSGPR
jgi:hypothetical protein